MNPVYEIVRRRLLQLGLPAAALWLAWQRFAARPVRPRLLDMSLFFAVLSVNLISIFSGPFRLGFPSLMTRLPPGRTRGRAVALTFDDGPDPETTPRLLDALREADARATFFVVAPQVVRHPDLAHRIAREGHTLGLHGARHDAVALWSVEQIEQELRAAIHAIESVAELPQLHLYRPPYGFKSRSVQRAADRMGLQLATWSTNPKDYTAIDADEIVRRVMHNLAPGAIILLHDKRLATVEALPILLNRLRGRQFRCVRL